MVELCQDERHVSKLKGILEDLKALKSLDEDDFDTEQIAVLNKYIELAAKGLNIAVFGDAVIDYIRIKEEKTGTYFTPIDSAKLDAIKERINNEKQKMNSHFGALANLQAILPETIKGNSIHKDLQNSLETLKGILDIRSQLVLYKECYPILAELVDLPEQLSDINLDRIMKTFSIYEVEKILYIREGKKDFFPVIVQGIHGLWKDNILKMFEECQRIGMNKVNSHKVILDFLATVFPKVWGYTEKTKGRLLKNISGHCNR